VVCRTGWLFLAIAALAGAAAVGGYFASQASDGTTAAQEVEQEPTPAPWQGPGAPALRVITVEPNLDQDEPAVTAAAPLPTSGLCLIGPTPIPASQQLPVTAKDIQQGPDGKYFVGERGDCCGLQEIVKLNLEGREWVLLGNPSCEVYWRYDPKTEEVVASPVMTPDKFPTPTPSAYEGPTPSPVPPGHFSTMPTPALQAQPDDARVAADGKYSIPDKGDGCTWQETGRDVVAGQLWVVLESPQCWGQFWFAPETGETRLDLHPRFALGADGKYFKIDFGDGCDYREVSRFVEEGRKWVRLQSATCSGEFLFAPLSFEVRAVVASPTSTPAVTSVPRSALPSGSEVKLGPDGKYYVPDRGDGCPWVEGSRFTGGTLMVVLHTQCEGKPTLVYYPETGEVSAIVP